MLLPDDGKAVLLARALAAAENADEPIRTTLAWFNKRNII